MPGAAPRPLRADGGADAPRQPVEPCFAGKPSAAVVREDAWSPRVADVVARAGALAAKGGDDAFLALRVDARDGRTTYARYVYGALALAAPKFRAAVDAALGPFGAVSHAPLKPSARCRGRRGAPPGDEPAAADVLDALSSAVAVDGHDALERARAALVARHEAAGPPLDRRMQSSHDAVQRILFEGVVCEVRFALGRAGKGCEIPNFKGSDLGRFPLVSADFWTSDHLSERSRSMDAFSGTRARGPLMLKRT